MTRTRLLLTAAWGVAALLLAGPARAEAPARPSFLNDVMPVFTRLGCNQGACHGKGAGQNGFRLSLRGYAPELDYARITREFDGRRVSPAAPEQSLLLRKPLGLAPHEGGKLFDAGSRAHRVLLDWIRAGMPGPSKSDREVRKLEILPGNRTLRPGQEQQLAGCGALAAHQLEQMRHRFPAAAERRQQR